MKDKKMYTEAEIEALAEKAAECAMEHFKHGLNCGECVVQGFLDLGLSDYPKEIVGLVSGMGGGMGFTHHTCGAVNAGLVVISSEKGRKNPYARETFAERVDELPPPRHGHLSPAWRLCQGMHQGIWHHGVPRLVPAL